MRSILTILIVFIFSGCASTSSNHNDLSEVVNDYFSVYSQRNDFERLMSFYDNNAQFEDIIYGNSLKNKKEIKGFLAWDRGEFKILSGERVLTVTKQVFGNNAVVTQGFFMSLVMTGKN